MSFGRETVLLASVLAFAYGCKPTPPFNEPPAGTYTRGTAHLKTDQGVTSVETAAVTPDFFTTAGVRPLLGRFIVEPDRAASPARVAVLSHDLWTRRFGSAPHIIGQPIDLEGRKFTIVGIAQPGFTFPGATAVWTSKDRGGL